MVKYRQQEEEAKDHVVDERQERWSPAVRGAISGIFLVSIGALFGFFAWLGLGAVTRNTHIAVLEVSDKSMKVHATTSEVKINRLQIDHSRLDTEVRLHTLDTNRHK